MQYDSLKTPKAELLQWLIYLQSHLVWPSNQRIISTSLINDITDQVFLSIICCQDTYPVCRITKQAHIHEDCHNILCFTKILKFKTRKKDMKRGQKKGYSSCKVRKNNICDTVRYSDKYFSPERNVPRSYDSLLTSHKPFWKNKRIPSKFNTFILIPFQRTAKKIYINIIVRHWLKLCNIYSKVSVIAKSWKDSLPSKLKVRTSWTRIHKVLSSIN